MKIVFMGTTAFGIPTIEALAGSGNTIAGIVTTKSREKGRGLKTMDSDIFLYAQKKNYGPILTPGDLRAETLVDDLKAFAADLFVVVAFRILPQNLFSIPPKGTFNIHASLLPKYRGPAPIQRAIAAGERETGITVFRIDQGIDTGNVVLQKKLSIGKDETSLQLSERLSLLGAQSMVETVSLIRSNSIVLRKQNHELASSAPRLLKSDGKIEWDLPAESIYNAIRAFKPFPGTFAFFDDIRVNIEWGNPLEGPQSGQKPGTVISIGPDGFDVQCGKGVLRVLIVRPEGKKSMGGRDFANGRKLAKGMIFS